MTRSDPALSRAVTYLATTREQRPDEVPCNATNPHDPHLWTFDEDYPLMQCPGGCKVRRADPLEVRGPCPACLAPLSWHSS